MSFFELLHQESFGSLRRRGLRLARTLDPGAPGCSRWRHLRANPVCRPGSAAPSEGRQDVGLDGLRVEAVALHEGPGCRENPPRVGQCSELAVPVRVFDPESFPDERNEVAH